MGGATQGTIVSRMGLGAQEEEPAPRYPSPLNRNVATPQVYRVIIPPNVQPSEYFVVKIQCPANARPGSTVEISVRADSRELKKRVDKVETDLFSKLSSLK